MRLVPHSGLANSGSSSGLVGNVVGLWRAPLPQPARPVKKERVAGRHWAGREGSAAPGGQGGRVPIRVPGLMPPGLMPNDHTLPSNAGPLSAARPAAPLAGVAAVPGDKSISHRALMLGALAVGRTEGTGLLGGEDVLATAAALRALGAEIIRAEARRWVVHGGGRGGR